MKKKIKETFSAYTGSDMNKKISEIKINIAKARSERYTKQPKNLRAIKNMKRELAVLMTYKRQHELQEVSHGK